MFSFLFLTQFSFSQTIEEKLEVLKRENDSLKIELEICRNSPALTLLNLENRILNTPSQKTEESWEEFREMKLGEIKDKSVEKYKVALSITESTDRFLLLCDSTKKEMIVRTGGYDQTKKIPIIGYKDKEIIDKVLNQEGKGNLIKSKIEELRQDYLLINIDSKSFVKKIVLTTDNWIPENYKGLPLAIIFPVLNQIQLDAKTSEKAVLEYLNE